MNFIDSDAKDEATSRRNGRPKRFRNKVRRHVQAESVFKKGGSEQRTDLEKQKKISFIIR